MILFKQLRTLWAINYLHTACSENNMCRTVGAVLMQGWLFGCVHSQHDDLSRDKITLNVNGQTLELQKFNCSFQATSRLVTPGHPIRVENTTLTYWRRMFLGVYRAKQFEVLKELQRRNWPNKNDDEYYFYYFFKLGSLKYHWNRSTCKCASCRLCWLACTQNRLARSC